MDLEVGMHPLGATPGITQVFPTRMPRTEHCEVTLNIGLFFDGTGNNKDWQDDDECTVRRNVSRPRVCRPIALWTCVLTMCCVVLAGCQKPPPENRMEGVTMVGIDHLPDHLSVQDYTLNGADGFQAGDGARVVCCATLPLHWYPGLTARVTWSVDNWRDCTGEVHETSAPVTRYDHLGRVYVHFLADGSVRIVSTDLGILDPRYPGTHDAIPQKEPWKVWPPRQHCPQDYTDPEIHEM